MRQGGSGRCNFPLPQNLTVEQTDYTLDAFEKRTATAAFSAKGDWTLSIVYDDADAGDETGTAWLTADAAGGAAGEQSLGMSAARNFQAAPRTAYVDLVCGEQTVRLTVTQTGLSDDMDFSALFDETFAQKLQQRDIVADAEKITMQEIQSMAIMTELDISGTYDNPGSLTSLRGIEYFEALTKLNCNRNSLPTLDISQNTELTYLSCENNPGDGNSVFPFTVWVDQAEKPGSLYVYQSGWWYNGKYITIEYQTAE